MMTKQYKSTREIDTSKRHGKHERYEAAAGIPWHII
jgi:hypothetical protein